MMRNCLAIYADSYVSGSRVWSVRKSGKPVADLELDFEGTNRGVPRLSQLYAVNNSEGPSRMPITISPTAADCPSRSAAPLPNRPASTTTVSCSRVKNSNVSAL